MKPAGMLVEVLNRWWYIPSGDSAIGVIGQSSRAIAGSLRNVPQDSVAGGSLRGRAPTGKPGGEIPHFPIELRILRLRRRRQWGFSGVSLRALTGTTVRRVKGPKCRLSVNLKGGSPPRQLEGRLRSSHPLSNA